MSYGQDIFGRKVLLGLTYEETQEFERLDAVPPIEKNGLFLKWEIGNESFPPSQTRWLELYKKHEAARSRAGGN
jgi:hypothetical protein